MKKRMLILRGLDIAVLNPHLVNINQYAREHSEDLEISLAYTEGEPDKNPSVMEAEKYFSGKVYYFPADVDYIELSKWIHENEFDVVVSLSMPDGNNVRDSKVKQYLEEKYGTKVIAHPLDVCMLMCDKYKTELHLIEHGFNPIPSHIVNNLHEALAVADKLSYPLIVKPAELCLSEGVEAIHNTSQLVEYFEKYGFPKMVQQFLYGTQISIEVIGHNGSYVSMVAISKEETGFSEHCPLEKFRVGPVKENIASNSELCLMGEKIARSLGIEGVIEVECIIHEGKTYILEINPRVSGVTNLSIASTGINVYIQLLEMGRGTFDASALKKGLNYVCEFPVKNQLQYDELTYLLKLPGVIHFERNKPEWFDNEDNFNLVNFGRFYISGKDSSEIKYILNNFERIGCISNLKNKVNKYL